MKQLKSSKETKEKISNARKLYWKNKHLIGII